MNWLQRLRHKRRGVEYVMLTSRVGDLSIRRAEEIGGHWYIKFTASRYRLKFDGSIEGWMASGMTWKPITDGVPNGIAHDK